MVLTEQALEQINTKRIRTMLALELDVTERWIDISIEKNKDNGILTTLAAINLIKKETGLKQSEIVTEEKDLAKAV